MMSRILRGLGPNVFALATASFFTDVASEMVFPLLPFFLMGTLKGSAAMVGLVEGTATGLSSLLRIFSGRLADRYRRHKLLVLLGYGLSVVARPLFGLAALGWHVLLVRVLDRFGKGIRLAPRDALIAASCAPEVRGKAFGFQKAMDHFGAALGPALASLLLMAGWQMRDVFYLTAIPATLVLVVIGVFVREVEPQAAGASMNLRLGSLCPEFRRFLLVIGLFTLGTSSDAFLILRAPQCGIPQEFVPLLWSGVNLTRMLFAIPGGMLSDRFDRGSVILVGWFVHVGVFSGLAFAETPTWFLTLAGISGLYHALGESVLRAFVADLAPKELRGTAYGLYYFAIGLASIPSSAGFGLIWKHFGSRPAFLSAAATSLVATLLFARLATLWTRGGSEAIRVGS